MIIDTDKSLRKFMKELDRKKQAFAFDTETTGLRYWDGDRIVGVSFFIPDDPHQKTSEGECYYLPFRHKKGKNLDLSAMKQLSVVFAKPENVAVGFNTQFDVNMLGADGVMVNNKVLDVMLAAHLANENEESFGLKQLSDKYVSETSSAQEDELLGKLKDVKRKADKATGIKLAAKQYIGYLTPEEVAPYAEQDAYLSWRLLKMYQISLEHQDLLELWIEVNRYSAVVSEMQTNGILIDLFSCKQYSQEAQHRRDKIHGEMIDMVGKSFNPRSVPQLRKILKQQSTDKMALAELDTPFTRKLLEYREWAKAENTYYKRFIQDVDRNHRLHANLNIIGTISGRLSCSGPNLQAVPRQSDIYKVRDVIVAPEHYALISADYSQAELRLLAHYTQDKFLIDTFKAGDDIHQATADRVGLERSEAKRINFGIVYGMGVPETALQLNISEQTAREYLDEYHKQIPGIRELYKEVEKRAMRSGYIRMWTGRRKHYDDLDETWKAMSNLIQGGVAELMRVAIMKLSHTLRGYNVRMLLQVHDDVLFEVPEIEVKDRFKLIKDTMEDFDFNVPIRVEVKAGKSWGGAVPIEKSGYLPKQRELDLGV